MQMQTCTHPQVQLLTWEKFCGLVANTLDFGVDYLSVMGKLPCYPHSIQKPYLFRMVRGNDIRGLASTFHIQWHRNQGKGSRPLKKAIEGTNTWMLFTVNMEFAPYKAEHLPLTSCISIPLPPLSYVTLHLFWERCYPQIIVSFYWKPTDTLKFTQINYFKVFIK